MRARWLVAAALVAACGKGTSERQLDVVIVEPDGGAPDGGVGDAGPDASVDAGTPDAGPADAGPADAGPADAGPADAGPADAGMTRLGVIETAHDSSGWSFLQGGLPGGEVWGASEDEGGNVWVAGGTSGVFVATAGNTQFRRFGLGDGLHPYGYLHNPIARDRGVPDGTPADPSPDLSATPVISVSGATPGVAFVGYQGRSNCEDEWDSKGPTEADHARADPAVYKSGDADRITLTGGGISVAHLDISSGPGVVPAEPLGREKLCSVYRILFEHGSDRVWIGANHGFALGFMDASVFEHVHPAINDVHNWFITGEYYGIALDQVPHADSANNVVYYDVWFGGHVRTTRFRFGESGGDYWKAQPRTELYSTGDPGDISKDPVAQAAYWNRMDIWPDPIGERKNPPLDWTATYPDNLNAADWVRDNVTGIAAMKSGDAWIGSWSNGLRLVDHDGHYLNDATAYLPSKAVGAVVRDPTDESVWIGYRDGHGVTRLRPDGSMLQYGSAALGGWAGSAVWDIQLAPGSPRRVLVAFRNGAVGLYSGP